MEVFEDIRKLKSFSGDRYNINYYEKGIETKTSGYQDYHWMPTRSYSEAIEIINNIDFDSVIDYGCGKGFLVWALRQLGANASGEDISDYALANALPQVKDFLSKPSTVQADLIICKDILEHIYESDMQETLRFLKNKCRKYVLAVVPLGDNNLFRIREYEIDVTHVTKKDEDWWIDQFRRSGLVIKKFSYSMGAIKEKWTKPYPHGNGFFLLQPAA